MTIKHVNSRNIKDLTGEEKQNFLAHLNIFSTYMNDVIEKVRTGEVTILEMGLENEMRDFPWEGEAVNHVPTGVRKFYVHFI